MVGTYSKEFQNIIVVAINMKKKRHVFLFIEGLSDSIQELVKAFETTSLQVIIKRELTLEASTPSRSHSLMAQPSKSNWEDIILCKGKEVGKAITQPQKIPTLMDKMMDEKICEV